MGLSFGQMAGLAGIGMLGSIGASGLGQVFTGHNMYRQYKYASKLQQQQYNLQMQGLREGYTNARQGLESAGYNPILAATGGSIMPSISSGSAGAPNVNVDNPVSGAVNAYRAFKLEKEQTQANIENMHSQTSVNNAHVFNIQQDTLNKEAQRGIINLDKQIREYESEMKKFDRDSQEYRFYNEMSELASRTKLNLEQAKFTEYNAISNRISSNAQQLNSQTNADTNAGNVANAKELEQWYKDHPYQAKLLRGLERYGKAAGTVLGGAGLGAAGYAAIKNANKVPLDSSIETAKFDSNGSYRGHTRTTRRLKRR